MYARHLTVSLLGTLALAGTGCSALVDTETVQCTKNEDCASLGGASATTTCDVARRVCVGRATGTEPGPSGKRCTSVSQCEQGEWCTHGPEGRCVNPITPQCTQVYPQDALTKDNTILIGLMAALTEQAAYGTPHKVGAQVAIEAINKLSGIRSTDDKLPARPLAAVICDQKDYQAAGNHLVKNLKVQAIVGSSTSGITSKLLNEITKPNGVLTFSPAATSPGLRSTEDDLFWRTVPADDLQMNAIRPIYPLVEKAVRAGGLGATAPIRLYILHKDDLAGIALRDAALERPLNTTPTERTVFQYKENAPATDWERYADMVLNFAPHIVMPLGTTEFVEFALERIEKSWNPANPRPWYVMLEGTKTDLLSMLAKSLGNQLDQRIVGVAPGARRGSIWENYVSNYRAFSQDTPLDASGEPGNLSEFAYDAVFLLSYAYAFAENDFPTGSNLRDGLKRTSCKASGSLPVRAGTADFMSGIAQALAKGCLDYAGASGPLDFTPLGETTSDFSIWCLTAAPQANLVSSDTYFDSQFNGGAGALLLTDGTPAMLDFTRAGWCKPRQ